MRRFIVFGLLALVGFTGCDFLTPRVCTLELRPSLRVTVVDSVSGENLAPEATVWVRDGSFVDTLVVDGREVYQGPAERERPGTYEVVAEHPDYMEWRRSGVRVEKGECHVRTEELTARLTPEP